MSQIFHLTLTGFVGGSQFNAANVRRDLAGYSGRHVDVMIDSFGGSLVEGLAISSAFRDHGDVTVHFRGASASAATIAAMGAAHIEISPEALILVHKVSMEFFDWADRNADQLEDFISALEKAKNELDTLDTHVATIYARRCKKPVKDMLALMKREVWISPKEALDYGFVDEISESENNDDFKTTISKAQASAFKSLGLPLPPVNITSDDISAVSTVINSIKDFFRMKHNSSADKPAGTATNKASDTTVNDVNNAGQHVQTQQEQAPTQVQTEERNDLQAQIDEIRNNMDRTDKNISKILDFLQPGRSANTKNVVSQAVNNAAGEQTKEETAFERFAKTSKSAKALFDSLP